MAIYCDYDYIHSSKHGFLKLLSKYKKVFFLFCTREINHLLQSNLTDLAGLSGFLKKGQLFKFDFLGVSRLLKNFLAAAAAVATDSMLLFSTTVVFSSRVSLRPLIMELTLSRACVTLPLTSLDSYWWQSPLSVFAASSICMRHWCMSSRRFCTMDSVVWSARMELSR